MQPESYKQGLFRHVARMTPANVCIRFTPALLGCSVRSCWSAQHTRLKPLELKMWESPCREITWGRCFGKGAIVDRRQPVLVRTCWGLLIALPAPARHTAGSWVVGYHATQITCRIATRHVLSGSAARGPCRECPV